MATVCVQAGNTAIRSPIIAAKRRQAGQRLFEQGQRAPVADAEQAEGSSGARAEVAAEELAEGGAGAGQIGFTGAEAGDGGAAIVPRELIASGVIGEPVVGDLDGKLAGSGGEGVKTEQAWHVEYALHEERHNGGWRRCGQQRIERGVNRGGDLGGDDLIGVAGDEDEELGAGQRVEGDNIAADQPVAAVAAFKAVDQV